MNQSSAFCLNVSMWCLCSKELQTEYKNYDIDRLALFEWEVVDVALFSKVLATIACLWNERYFDSLKVQQVDRY